MESEDDLTWENDIETKFISSLGYTFYFQKENKIEYEDQKGVRHNVFKSKNKDSYIRVRPKENGKVNAKQLSLFADPRVQFVIMEANGDQTKIRSLPLNQKLAQLEKATYEDLVKIPEFIKIESLDITIDIKNREVVFPNGDIKRLEIIENFDGIEA